MHKTSVPGIYTLIRPETALPLVYDSPHSGSVYPDDFDYSCGFDHLEKTEDRFVDELFGGAPDNGGALLAALFPRSYVDVNRAEDDIDMELLDGRWPHPFRATARSDAGIGLLRRLVHPGLPVYSRQLSVGEVAARIEKYYLPYHAALEALLNEAHYRFGQVWHINCHSMPSANGFLGSIKGKSADIVLGDRDGSSCSPAFTHAVRDFFRGLGYSVALNDPYKGVELVRRYSSPARGRHSLQIELCRSLYLNEATSEKSANFPALQKDIGLLCAFLADYAQSQLVNLAAD